MMRATIEQYNGDDITEFIEDDEGGVSVELPWDMDWEAEEEEGGGPAPDDRSPLRWCNGAGATIREDSVQVWISTGDPRGAFAMTIYCASNGELRIELPYEGMGFSHEDLEKINDGLLLISRTRSDERKAA